MKRIVISLLFLAGATNVHAIVIGSNDVPSFSATSDFLGGYHPFERPRVVLGTQMFIGFGTSEEEALKRLAESVAKSRFVSDCYDLGGIVEYSVPVGNAPTKVDDGFGNIEEHHIRTQTLTCVQAPPTVRVD